MGVDGVPQSVLGFRVLRFWALGFRRFLNLMF